ncbi:hypothetical protein [Rubellimicrobium roseum]|uniref:Anti-sigma factor NepR domain-containing protein n=1 Tax=Rubellimicrobium roseum TaxID=687525 RepID=A0A5C4NKD7_9RHOB|nr:hypothetical protein [Rubellimicrobium roseum]TNC73858.1 hypothetical protein FHG71_05150 [Rubellimicrobium roseum]
MDELSTHELRGAAFAANLRRAFGAPVEGDMPASFATLLSRLGEVQRPASALSQRHDANRLGA